MTQDAGELDGHPGLFPLEEPQAQGRAVQSVGSRSFILLMWSVVVSGVQEGAAALPLCSRILCGILSFCSCFCEGEQSGMTYVAILEIWSVTILFHWLSLEMHFGYLKHFILFCKERHEGPHPRF